MRLAANLRGGVRLSTAVMLISILGIVGSSSLTHLVHKYALGCSVHNASSAHVGQRYLDVTDYAWHAPAPTHFFVSVPAYAAVPAPADEAPRNLYAKGSRYNRPPPSI